MVNIRFKRLKIDKIKNGSGLFYGENIQYKWTKKTVKADGLGYVKGNGNTLARNSTLIFKGEKDSG
ncbi:hypothetical protein ACQCVK_19860 [Rossellomorea vietnamensis]|uniref:hypothetical protein n=1 Tax=Rossellomorea vietnamensis TaxID=218284 RepID=UPI003CF09F05